MCCRCVPYRRFPFLSFFPLFFVCISIFFFYFLLTYFLFSSALNRPGARR